MGRVSKIEAYDLRDVVLGLYFDKGFNGDAIADRINEDLATRGIDDSIHRAAVNRFLKAERETRQAQARAQYKDYASQTLSNDLDALEEVKGWHLFTFRDENNSHKKRRNAAVDLVKTIETKLKLALACDSGDKAQVLSIVKNEVAALTDGGRSAGDLDYTIFQRNPTAFGEVILGETYTDDVKTLMDSVRDNQVTVARSANATGKTHAAARIATWWLKCFQDSQVYTAAAPPENNLKKLLWGEIVGLTENHPDIFKDFTTQSLHISRSAQSFLTGVTIPMSGTEQAREAKFSGKHAPHLLFILDEGDAIPDEVYRGIESCMSGGNARLLVMFNPRGEQGEVWRMERDERAAVVELTAFRHPNVVTGEDVIPGAVTRDKTISRIHKWTRPLSDGEQPDSECFRLPEFLEGETTTNEAGKEYPPLKAGWYKIMEPAFAYMVLGQYPSVGSSQLISREWVSRARARWDSYVVEKGEVPPAGVRPVSGLDVAEFGVDANVFCSRYGGWVARMRSWTGMDPVATTDRAVTEAAEAGSSLVNVDGTGVGAGVAPGLVKQDITAFSVKTAGSATKTTELGDFKILRDQLWWECRQWLWKDPGAMLPPDDLLIEELLLPDYRVDGGKIRIMQKDVMKEKLKRSPDRADALVLTFHDPGQLFSEADE
jgi:hypothetical protein